MHLELFHITLNNMQLVNVIGSLGVKFMFDLRINHTCRYYTICYFWGEQYPSGISFCTKDEKTQRLEKISFQEII